MSNRLRRGALLCTWALVLCAPAQAAAHPPPRPSLAIFRFGHDATRRVVYRPETRQFELDRGERDRKPVPICKSWLPIEDSVRRFGRLALRRGRVVLELDLRVLMPRPHQLARLGMTVAPPCAKHALEIRAVETYVVGVALREALRDTMMVAANQQRAFRNKLPAGIPEGEFRHGATVITSTREGDDVHAVVDRLVARGTSWTMVHMSLWNPITIINNAPMARAPEPLSPPPG